MRDIDRAAPRVVITVWARRSEVAGLFFGQLSGPDWLTGGAFGVEGSAVTLVALAGAASLLVAFAYRGGGVRGPSLSASGTKSGR